MTIQGARDELINMMECKDIPFYFVPILQKVVETIEMEIVTGCDIDAIKAEINKQAWEIAISDTDRANGMWDAYRIIDKYREEQTDAT